MRETCGQKRALGHEAGANRGSMKTIKTIFGIDFYILFPLVFLLSACKPSNITTPAAEFLTPQPTTTKITYTPFLATPTSTPQVVTTINGVPFSFTHKLQIINDTPWFPSQELFELLEEPDINRTDTFISTAYYDANGKFINCHFPVGEGSYSTNTNENIWINTQTPAFIIGDEIYLSKKMIEDCLGEFIMYDQATNSVNLNIENRKTSLQQLENSNPVSFFKQKETSQLRDSRIGALVSGVIKDPASYWLSWVEKQKSDGFTRMRITMNASDGPAVNSNLDGIEKKIPLEYIEIYRKMNELGIQTRYSLSFWDLEFRQNGGTISHHRLNEESEIERYLEYVRMVVTSMKGLVTEYELWNEPDANDNWYQRIDPQDYITVAKRAIPLIRELDPAAKIVLVSTSSYVDKPCQEYSKIILESDIMSMADAISLHTVNNDASPVFKSDYYYGYDEMWNNIKALAEAHGFSGEYYADELNYRSNFSLAVLQPEQGDYHPYKPEIAAKYFGRMIAINLGQDISVGTSGTDTNNRIIEARMIRNMAYLMDGLKADNISVVVDSSAKMIRYYTFKDTNGDLYIAIWNDVEALVESADVMATLIIPDQNAKDVTAYNPYLMNVQTLNFESTSDRIVLNQLLIKDYPLIYKIELQ
jgi:hypothetical protein